MSNKSIITGHLNFIRVVKICDHTYKNIIIIGKEAIYFTRDILMNGT